MGIPKSTLSEWLKTSGWSAKVKRTLIQKAKRGHKIRLQELNSIRGQHLIRLYQQARHEAEDEFKDFKFHPAFISGVVIYWGEGERTSRNLIRVANTDPLMIRLFVNFLQEVCGVPKGKIRAHILLYPDLNSMECKNFWVQQSSLPLENFNKSVLIEGRHKTRRLPYGVCYITVCSTYLKQKMDVWLTLLPKELIKKEYYAGVVQR
ncbi:MAG: hypothetical protein HYS60_02765 [Candidatus Wildermuthbacteria bacterium]|nr:hypothetical protein [Candidatus Wildermuthbacteria bacterium]